MYLAGVTAPTVPPTTATRLLRAFTLRCPECGSGGLFRHWLLLQPRCPRCALKTDRGNRDHFVGAYLLNLIVAELLFAALFGAWMLITFGLVMLEAMACGLPAAAYPVPGPIDVIGDSGAGAADLGIGASLA